MFTAAQRGDAGLTASRSAAPDICSDLPKNQKMLTKNQAYSIFGAESNEGMNKVLPAIFTVCLVGSGACWLGRSGVSDLSTHGARPPKSEVSLGSAVSAGARQAAPPKSNPSGQTPAVPEETLGLRIEALSKSANAGNAADAFQAYQLARTCFSIPEREGSVPLIAPENVLKYQDEIAKDKLSCASVTPRQIYDRTQNLRIAMHAGIRDAIMANFLDGPHGDIAELVSRPDDLLVQQWKSDAEASLNELASTGDKEALWRLSSAYQGGELFEADASKAYMYQYALREISQQDGTKFSRGREILLNILASKLSSEQLAAARREGAALARQCCARSE